MTAGAIESSIIIDSDVAVAFLVRVVFRVPLAVALGLPFRPFPAIDVVVAVVAVVAVVRMLSSTSAEASPSDINEGASENAVRFDWMERRDALEVLEGRPFFICAGFLVAAYESIKMKK